MPNRFDKQRDLQALESLEPERRIAVAAAALERMRVGYSIWAPQAVGRESVDQILVGVWAFVVEGKPLPGIEAVECLYPTADDSVTLESPYAESFLEALQLFTDFSVNHNPMRLVEVRQAAYNMADNAAGDSLVRYNDPGFNHRLTPEMDNAMSIHPWVDRELSAQDADVHDAEQSSGLRELVDQLRSRAATAPVVAASELEQIRQFQGDNYGLPKRSGIVVVAPVIAKPDA